MRTAHTVTLPDGRSLGFAQYGDPKGKPVFLFHGWPSSRLSGAKYDSLAKKLHIRIIAPDRPGYGLSEYQPDRTLLEWSDDVAALADHLKIKKFAVMGVSGGGPYAAVCAYKIPMRITKLGIVVGLGPILGPHSLDGVMWISKIGWENFGKHAIVRRISVIIQYLYAKSGWRWDVHNRLFGAKTDKELYSDPVIRLWGVRGYREAFRKGYAGPELDLKLYTSDWGFDVSDIKSQTYLWYGADDQNVSLNMGKYYASHIRGSRLTVYPGEGHLISITHAAEILRILTS